MGADPDMGVAVLKRSLASGIKDLVEKNKKSIILEDEQSLRSNRLMSPFADDEEDDMMDMQPFELYYSRGKENDIEHLDKIEISP